MFIKLKAYSSKDKFNGTDFWMSVDKIIAISPDTNGSAVTYGGLDNGYYRFQETPEEILKLIEAKENTK